MEIKDRFEMFLTGLIVSIVSILLFSFLAHGTPLDTWRSNMISYGQQHCNFLKAAKATNTYPTMSSEDDVLNASYYDGQRVYFQIKDYTNDNSWNECAEASEWVYRDNYLQTPSSPAGYWNFGRGLALSWSRFSDSASAVALDRLANEAVFCRGNAWEMANINQAQYSREVAYCVGTFIEMWGIGRLTPRLSQYKDFAKGHISQWTSGSYPLQPFMGGLTAEALITYYERVGLDLQILTLVYNLEVELWKYWDSASKSFLYDGDTPAPDLNLLIAPLFAWYYAKTGDTWSRDRFDEIFAGGVDGAYLNGAKQFNQNYRWSIQGVAWRYGSMPPIPSPAPSPTRTPTRTATAMPTKTPTPSATRTATPCSMAQTLSAHHCRIFRLEAR